ncbi:hypothetical protein WMY93_010783 [Mugilogobius chulae]|uniref:Uncharacterized protein n=1 Tax=Mugilogobius chulae TaxID=88201 RepID=A0AAW0PC52_9GOBI
MNDIPDEVGRTERWNEVHTSQKRIGPSGLVRERCADKAEGRECELKQCEPHMNKSLIHKRLSDPQRSISKASAPRAHERNVSASTLPSGSIGRWDSGARPRTQTCKHCAQRTGPARVFLGRCLSGSF